MPPPSKLAVATSSVNRLVKEEASYHKEMAQQEARIKKLEAGGDGGDNVEYELRQERQALEETKKVIPSVKQRLEDAIAKVEDQLDDAEDAAEITKAKEVIEAAKKTISESKDKSE